VGSVPWLLRHELRLAWRGVGGRDSLLLATGGAMLWVLAHLVAWLLLRRFDSHHATSGINLVLGGLTWLIVSLMLSQAILLSVSALFDRGDFDLLLSSPLSTRTVFFVRSLGVAVSCTAIYFALLSPFAHIGLVTSQPNLLAIYPALLALGLLVSSLGMLLTLTLVQVLGARRARTAAQLIGALTGAALFLLTQSQSLLSDATRSQLNTLFARWSMSGGLLAPESPLWFPLQAMLGRPLPLLVVVAAGCAGFWLVTTVAHRRFLAGTQTPVTGKRTGAQPLRRATFRAGVWRNVLVKEWKLIARDATLISQTLLQTLYLIPAIFVLARHEDVFAVLAPSVVLLAGALASNLAWITVAAEEAPELIASSPAPFERIRQLKVLAALIPVWALVSPLFLVLLTRSLLHALVFVVGLIGATVSAGVTQVWYPRRGDRKNMRKRHKSNQVVNLLEAFSMFGWAGAVYCLQEAPLYSPIPLAFALLVPVLVWFMGRERRSAFA
jgi:ABC-2 type transport system permease protein